MRAIDAFFRKLREISYRRGYACDDCGREVFDYPVQRLCGACLQKLLPVERACPKCGRATVSDGVCLACKSDPPSFTQGVSAYVYVRETAALVNRLKNGDRRLACFLGEETAKAFLARFPELSDRSFLVLPVPITKRKRAERGYNQAEELAEVVVRELKRAGVDVTLERGFLIKDRERSQQKDLDSSARKRNARSAYRLTNRKACKDRTVLLVDDILTTGATGGACAERLLAAGAKEVYFLTAAALPERPKP